MKSAKNRAVEKSLQDYEAGRITLWQAAENSGLTLWEIIDEVGKRHVCISYSIGDLKEDLKELGLL